MVFLLLLAFQKSYLRRGFITFSFLALCQHFVSWSSILGTIHTPVHLHPRRVRATPSLIFFLCCGLLWKGEKSFCYLQELTWTAHTLVGSGCAVHSFQQCVQSYPTSVPLCSFSTSYTGAIRTEHSATVTTTLKNKFSLLNVPFQDLIRLEFIHIFNIFKTTGTLSFTFQPQHAVWCNIRHAQAAPEAPLYPSCRVTEISLLIRCPYCSKSKYSPEECESCAAVRSAGTEVFLSHVPGTNALHTGHYIAASSLIFTAESV